MSLEDCLQAPIDCGAPMVSICGGEPLIYPQIEALTNGILQQGRIVYMCTNAMFMRRKMRQYMASRYAAQTAREFGARSVGVIAPYLAYMRQDTRFNRGEAISAQLFARFLEETFDWLVTVDPHLHRFEQLQSLYGMPATHVSATPAIAGWIAHEIPDAMLVGPDSESEQWVARIAAQAGVPYQVLSKERRGDYDVRVSLPDGTAYLSTIATAITYAADNGARVANISFQDRKSTRLNSSHLGNSYAVFCLKKKKKNKNKKRYVRM